MESSRSKEILEGVQFLISKWESNEISDEMALALIEVHLEREATLIRPLKLPEPYNPIHSITQG